MQDFTFILKKICTDLCYLFTLVKPLMEGKISIDFIDKETDARLDWHLSKILSLSAELKSNSMWSIV